MASAKTIVSLSYITLSKSLGFSKDARPAVTNFWLLGRPFG